MCVAFLLQLLWRRARLRFLAAKAIPSQAEDLVAQGLADAKAAVHVNTANANAHKWCAAGLSLILCVSVGTLCVLCVAFRV